MEEKQEKTATDTTRYDLYLKLAQISAKCGKYGLLLGMLAVLVLEILTTF